MATHLQVTAMLSEEGEKLSLKTTFNPKAAGGNVEKWFIEAEAAMRETVKDVTRKSFDAHAVSKRIDWVLQWPGQVSATCVHATVGNPSACVACLPHMVVSCLARPDMVPCSSYLQCTLISRVSRRGAIATPLLTTCSLFRVRA